MLSMLQEQKLTHLFNIYDSDHDGYLEKSDYESFAIKIASAFGWGDSAEVQKQLHTHFMQEWQQIQQFADLDGDQRVALQDWLIFYDQLLASTEMTEMAIKAYMTGYYELWDIVDPENSHLGHVMTLDRFRKFFIAYDAPVSAADEAFRRIDHDNDGIMETDEIFNASLEFFGDDPEAPGNYLFGPYAE